MISGSFDASTRLRHKASADYRPRLVARQLEAIDTSGKSYFAPAPPLDALPTVITMAMTEAGQQQPDWNLTSKTRVQISLLDIKRADFNAQVDPKEPEKYVQLQHGDSDHESMCGLPLRHM